MSKVAKKKRLGKFTNRLVATWRLFWQQRAKLTLIAGLVVVPSSFVRAYGSLATDLSILLTVAGFYCLLALIYYCHNLAKAQELSVAKIYTNASGRFLQLIGVAIIQSIALLPTIFAATLIIFIGAFGLPTWLYLPGIVVLLGSLIGVMGLGLSQFIVVAEDVSVIGALRLSWQRTKKLRVSLLWQIVAFCLLISALSSLVFFVVNLSLLLSASWFAQGLTSSLVVTPFLAWFIVFGYSLYDEISQ